MSGGKSEISRIWKLHSSEEKRNIVIYIIGIMLYKFGLEAFNGSIISLAINRYDQEAFHSNSTIRTFERVGLISGINQVCQCIGSVLVTPLAKLVDIATGGHIKPKDFVSLDKHDDRYYGRYNTNEIIPIYCITSVAFGMVELIRRVMSRDIVGDNGEKLQKMDALVHIFYEITGVSGALMTGLVLIPRLRNNYAFTISPILFTVAAAVWFFISSFGLAKTNNFNDEFTSIDQKIESNYFTALCKKTCTKFFF
ncbi:unnamed protein product [Rotaria magnacalcarata]|uniref:Uncharacterized protein n=1 Tax=Rotaria magnacalcarata TaxID=392030 RepID=A0A819XVP0_9BILA|nr:unnamed protein product [Rotaria magnacalcarata]CAF4145393.1 unnamed protein product [Rotaria magnacalcarata]